MASSTVVVCRASSVWVMWPMIAMCALVAVAGAVLVSSASGRPSHADLSVGESVEISRDVAFRTDANSGSTTSSRLSCAPGSWSWGSRTAQISPSPLERPGRHARGEAGVRVGEQAGDVIERAALSRFRGVADEEHELVGVVAGRFDLEEGAVADHRAARDQQLGEDRDRVRLGVRREPLDDRAGQSVIGGRVRRCRPPVRRPGAPSPAWTASWSFGEPRRARRGRLSRRRSSCW